MLHKEEVNSHAGLNAHGQTSKRFAVRRTCNLPAMIVKTDVGWRTPCCVLDISASGARLKMEAEEFGSSLGDGLNDETFWLRLAHEGSQVRCRITWRDGNNCGVHFVSPMERIARQRKPRPNSSMRKKGFFGLIGS